MAKQRDENRKKGTFSGVRLSVAKKYLFPFSRKQMLLIGGGFCVLVGLYYLTDAFLLGNTFIASGPLSSNHANFESDCAKCHQSFRGVKNVQCSTCHEKTNDEPGVYSFAAHYLYRSEHTARVQSAEAKHASDEGSCATCHPDHRGRNATITQVSDARCSACHFASFNKDHPQFAFAKNAAADDSTLKMTHVLHTKEVLKLLKTPNIEQACLYCHVPQDDGKAFKPLDFDAHCGDCHLTSNSETPSLAVRDPANPMSVGVESLEMIQRRRGPGTRWAFYTNPNEFSLSGSRIKKSPVYHRDPWILENLKQLYRMSHTDSTLGDLLDASGHAPSKSRRELYSESIRTLEEYAAGLRARPEPEIQSELARIDSLLKEARRQVVARSRVLPDFPGGKSLSATQEVDDFAQKLAKPCLECHYLDHTSLLPVKASQRTLYRAEFDHRAHILQKRCLECHNVIPVERALAGDTTGVAAIDKASTQNLPAFENCYQCHTKEAGSNACVTCHYMHPNKLNRSNLQLFVERK